MLNFPTTVSQEPKVEETVAAPFVCLKKRIVVTFSRAGIHAYPGAPGEVLYLAAPHRHLFKFKVSIVVYHDDREIEFHMFLNWLGSQYDSGVLQLNNKSCEMLCDDLAAKIARQYKGRMFSIEVWEDGECGAVADYAPASAR